MILIDDILELHKKSIEEYGGSHGIRDIGLLESAIARPFQTFGGNDLYPTIFEKAAALGESLIINHRSLMEIKGQARLLWLLYLSAINSPLLLLLMIFITL